MRAWLPCLVVLLLSASVFGQTQPIDDPEFPEHTPRDEITTPGNWAGALRVLRFIHISDAHVIDDDAPYPVRQEPLDTFGPPLEGAARPQDEYSDEYLDAMIQVINARHSEDALDFVINTGDNIDNNLENELMRFIDNWEGTFTTAGPISGRECAPDGQSVNQADNDHDSADLCTHLPAAFAQNNTPLAQDLPWLSAFGNHDGLIQGNVNPNPQFDDIAEQYGRMLLSQPDYVSMHFQTGASCIQQTPQGTIGDDFGHGYGYAGPRLCDDNPDNDGYYAFDHRGVRVVVLDTINDDIFEGNDNLAGTLNPAQYFGADYLGGYAEGSVDPEQFTWLQNEIESNPNQMVLVFAHHTVNSMFYSDRGACGPPGCIDEALAQGGYKTEKEMTEYLAGAPNVIGFFGGHAHVNQVEPKITDLGSFWNVETASVIDMPQEARIVEMWITDNGTKGAFVLTPFTHDNSELQAIAELDTQRHENAFGNPEDRDVVLWFDLPANTTYEPQPSVRRSVVLNLLQPVAPAGEPAATAGEEILVQIQATDSVTGAPIEGLQFRWDVVHAPSAGNKTLAGDVVAQSLTDAGNGRYEGQFTPPENATYFLTAASAATATYPPEAEMWSIRVGTASAQPVEEESPGIELIAIMGALACLVVVHRRRSD